MNNQPDIDNIYLSAKYLYESKYKYVINKRKTVGLYIVMILKLLFNAQMICKMLIKISMNTI